MSRIIASSITLLACLLLLGCGGDQPADPPADPSADTPTGDGAGGSPLATLVRGGQLYDKFWKASSIAEPTDAHPLWAKRPDMTTNTNTGSTTWRCKECHGWDYRGVEGAYARGSHKTGFPGVVGSKLSAEELTESIAETHAYRAAGLSDVDLESLVLFLREGLVDMSKWIDENGAFRGDAKRGQKLYLKSLGKNKSCSECHGPSGLKPPKGPDASYEDFVGKIATTNPWEFLHKVRFGQPGTKMPAAVTAGVPMQDIIDLSAYAQTLPTSK